MPLVVTIDGPAGAGKSTAARGLAERLGWRHLDTGAMFRVVTLAALRSGVDPRDEAAMDVLTASLDVLLEPGRVLLGDEDVTEAIRAVEVTRASGPVAGSPGVRRRLMEWQRRFAEQGDTVTEGRDQGTVVFPDAVRKFFVSASEEARGRRRHAELVRENPAITLDEVIAQQRARDAADAARELAPMKPAPDALQLDTTELTLEQVLDLLERHVREASEARHG
jgi:cytidylate kinase